MFWPEASAMSSPFQPYTYGTASSQWLEWFRSPHKLESISIDTIYQVDPDTVRFVVEPYAPEAGIYELTLPDQRIKRLFPVAAEDAEI